MKLSRFTVFFAAFVLLFSTISRSEILFTENFEGGWGNWSTTNGTVWEIGVPGVGPSAAHEGTQVAATVLSGNYPDRTDSYLISPDLILPIPGSGEHIELRFWQWYEYQADALGRVYLSVWNGTSWDSWQHLLRTAQPQASSDWSKVHIDLTAYAGQTVRIGFYHSHGSYVYRAEGWYLDEVQIWKGIGDWTGIEGFESGWGDWYTDRGVWEVGNPTTGPSGAHEGTQVAATVLSGDYPERTDSYLISPAVVLPNPGSGEHIELRFWQWYEYQADALGQVYLSVWNGTSWDSWQHLLSTAQSQTSSDWSKVHIDLTAYAGQTVRIGFHHSHGSYVHRAEGWYLDEIQIWKGIGDWTGIEGFESGWGDWYTNRGLWEVGNPTTGPSGAHEGMSVAATVLSGDYPDRTDSYLISPGIILPSPGLGEHIELRFWQWYEYQADALGQVYLSVWNGTGWDSWQLLLLTAQQETSSGWSKVHIDLTAYAGQTVRIGFYHSHGSYVYRAEGWYLDEVQIWKGIGYWTGIEGFESGWGDWYTDRGLWEVGNPTTGPSGAHEGMNVAATVLSGDYPDRTDSRLISPAVMLPTPVVDQNITLNFWQWYEYEYGASGQVQISKWDGTGWQTWQPLFLAAPQETSSDWSQVHIDLTAYAEQIVRIGFYHSHGSYAYRALGWYLDEITLNFPSQKTISVLSPNGGERILAGESWNILWMTSTDPNVTLVDLEYSDDNSASWNLIEESVTNTGSYLWDTPPGTHSDQCLVRISDSLDNLIYDQSDSVFTIFTCQKYILADLNNDCYVDFKDMALFALSWLDCGNPFDPMCLFP